MSLHPHSKHVHIGGDEVVNMGHCPDCFKLVQSYGREELFRRHMLVVMKHVVTHWDGVRCLFWDDMIRRWDLEKLKVRRFRLLALVCLRLDEDISCPIAAGFMYRE